MIEFEGYTIHTFKPKESVKLNMEIKKYLAQEYGKLGYDGFSIDYDSQYDPYSTYFLAQNDQKDIIATARCTHRTATNKIPFEDGLQINQKNSYNLSSSNLRIIDINSFIYKDPRILQPFLTEIARHLSNNNIDRVFCLLDSKSKRYKRLYFSSGFKLSKEFSTPIYFKTFTNKFGVPVRWHILEGDRTDYQRVWGV